MRALCAFTNTMNSKLKIPSDIEFARAKKKMAERTEKENEFKNDIVSALTKNIPFHDVWVWLSDKELTVSYIFPNDADLEQHQDSAINKTIEDAIERTVQRMGIENVLIEYHSHEYVLAKYNGNYENYFR